MHKINYRPGKLMLSAAASLLVALWLGYGWSSDDSMVWIAGAALFAYFAFASIRTAIWHRYRTATLRAFRSSARTS